tara:strand:+ start:620 stop:1090 length:471 start_codon:yes stop_codon:yes gene_type:complete
MSALGKELVAAAIEGLRERKRLADFERANLASRIASKWVAAKPEILKLCKGGAARPAFLVDTRAWCREYAPNVKDVLNALPEEVKAMRRVDSERCGYFVTIHESYDTPGKYEIVFSIHERVNKLVGMGALEGSEEEQEEEEEEEEEESEPARKRSR